MQTHKEIIAELLALYPTGIKVTDTFPEAYCPGGISNVKAIYLGCDPSNQHSSTLPYAFAHESKLKIFNSFLKSHTEQLTQIGLGWDKVYTQNLCRNYFEKETSKNPIWKEVAEAFWIERLKTELAVFDANIPVLLTAQVLLEVLGKDGYEKKAAADFYEGKEAIPIPAISNKLNRDLIPLYRGRIKHILT